MFSQDFEINSQADFIDNSDSADNPDDIDKIIIEMKNEEIGIILY